MVAEGLVPYRYEKDWKKALHSNGRCWGGYLGKKEGYPKSDRAYRVPSSINGASLGYLIYCEECCQEKGWVW
ncbi:hypothetical protein LCGC14_3084470 [marine sediment metagenome]|uniref:Uncharacterized protein n=1 Tax=marine sediment metagenome TaxID=412755 RepID=A0A0F8X0Y4_9ZZZZ